MMKCHLECRLWQFNSCERSGLYIKIWLKPVYTQCKRLKYMIELQDVDFDNKSCRRTAQLFSIKLLKSNFKVHDLDLKVNQIG